jgi:hypothetical protein
VLKSWIANVAREFGAIFRCRRHGSRRRSPVMGVELRLDVLGAANAFEAARQVPGELLRAQRPVMALARAGGTSWR